MINLRRGCVLKNKKERIANFNLDGFSHEMKTAVT